MPLKILYIRQPVPDQQYLKLTKYYKFHQGIYLFNYNFQEIHQWHDKNELDLQQTILFHTYLGIF